MGKKTESRLGDTRLSRSFSKLLESMINHQSVVLRQLAVNDAHRKQIYRLIHNNRLKPKTIVEEHWRQRAVDFMGKHLLVVGDTTILTMSTNSRHKNVPLLTNNSDKRGFALHACIMLDAQSAGAYGLGAIQANTAVRVPEDEQAKEEQLERRKKVWSMPLEDKKRAKWLSVPREAIQNCPGAARYTLVGDREADIYDLMAKCIQQEWGFLYRCRTDRLLAEEERLLYKFLESRSVQLCHQMLLPATKSRSAHTAWLDIKFGKVTIKQLRYKRDLSLPGQIECYVVQAIEQQHTVVGHEDPVHWIILTSHSVNNAEEALQILQWYTWRWVIEQVFRTMKKEGLGIESSEVKDQHGLEVLATMACIAALAVMQLVQARGGQTQDKVEQVFCVEGRELLHVLNERLQGRTGKLKNPHAKESLAYASWVVARLGGWSGYASERPPGPITITRGLTRFFDILTGYVSAVRLVT